MDIKLDGLKFDVLLKNSLYFDICLTFEFRVYSFNWLRKLKRKIKFRNQLVLKV